MELKNNEPCLSCGRYANRGITIDAVIVRDNKILLIKRGAEPFKDFWALPGGYVEWDETVEETVKREVAEETGLVVKSLEMIGVYSNPDRHPKQCIDVAFAVEGLPAEEAEGITAGDDAVEIGWFDVDNLPPLAFDHEKIIKDYLEKK